MPRSRIWTLIAVVLAFALVAAACGDDADDTTTAAPTDTTAAPTDTTAAPTDTTAAPTDTTAAPTDMVDMSGADFVLVGAPTSVEGDAMQGFLDVYNEAMGSDIVYDGSDDFENQQRIRVEGGNPPQVGFWPQPAAVCEYGDAGELVALEDMGFDIAQMEANHGKFWMDLGVCADGKHYGIPWFPNFKSIVFYREPVFEAEGYAVPSTYEDLVALSAQMVSDGYTPWCFGFAQQTGPPGWPGTDWIEDIVVRNSGADVYAQWFKHEIPFNDPEIAAAFDLLGQIMFGEGFVLGGAENVGAITFQDSPGPLFAEDPKDGCLMLKQGSFIQNLYPEGADASIINFFPFPTIGGNTGAMGGGDTIIVFDDDPQIVQAVKDWTTPEWGCVLASASGGTASTLGGHGVAGVERLPGHKDISPDCYESDLNKVLAQALTDALAVDGFVFDASDLMPSAVGAGSFWTGMVDWTRGKSTQDVLDEIEASWPQ